MIDCPVNTNDYNIPQIHPQPVEPTQSVVEIKEPVLARPTATPPPLEAIKEENELETEQQQQQEEEEEESQLGASNLIPVTMENLEIAKNKPCINNCIGMEISECDDTDYCINPGNSTECIPSENSNPKPCSNTQMNSNSNTTPAKVA